MSEPPSRFRIVVPATSANLGPGFDCLALALDLHNMFDVEPLAEGEQRSIAVRGEGSEGLPRGDDNLVVRAMGLCADAYECELPPFRLQLVNAVPVSRGMGSSAAAIIGGLMAGATLLRLPIERERLLRLALRLESHPDNIAAALYGGFTIGVVDNGRPVVRRLDPPAALRCVLLVPERSASTREARAVLEARVSRASAVFNAGRCALLAADLASGRLDSLATAMQDRLHQEARTVSFPYLPRAIEAALEAGALGASLSGAGSSVIALVATAAQAEDVAVALAAVAEHHQLAARVITLKTEPTGARVDRVG